MALDISAGFLNRSTTSHYGFAVLAVAAATGLRLAFDPVLGAYSPYLPFVAAIIVAVRIGGCRPGLAATALSSLSVWYIFLSPRYSFGLSEPVALVGLGVFASLGGVISLMGTPGQSPAREHPDKMDTLRLQRVALLAGAALALGTLSSLLWSGFTRSQVAARRVEQTYRVLNAVASVRSLLTEAETSERGYLLTGDDPYLVAYQSALVADKQARAALRRLTLDNPTQQARLDEFDRIVQERLDLLARAIQVRREQGATAAAGLVSTGRGKERMNQLRAILDAVDDEERRLLQSLTMATDAAESRARWILGLGSGSLVLLLLLAGAAIDRSSHERKRAEKVLAYQARLIDLSHDAIITADGNRVISGWNAGAQEMYGWTGKEAVGQTIHELLQTGAPHPMEEIDRIVAREGRWDGEVVHTRSDGRRIVTESRQVLLRDDAGLPAGFLEINRDITRRKQAEEARRESEGQFQSLANAIPQLCWMANADGWIFWYNQRWYEYTGTTPEQMEGWGWQSVHDPEMLSKVLAQWQGSIATGELFDMVFPLRGADGVFRPFLTRVMPVRDRDGRIARWFGTNTDISEQRRSEEALRESRAKLEAALASMTDAVFISDAEGRFVHFNDAFVTFHRFRSKAQCCKRLAEYPAFLEVLLPDGTPMPLEMWAVPRALRGEAAANAEYSLRRKDTGETWVGSYSYGPIRDPDGLIVGAVVVGRDTTDRKRAEEEIGRLNAELEQRVRDRTAQLEASNKELEAFAYSVSHDLRAPLRGIDGWSLALMEDYGSGLEGRALEYLERVRSETQRMGHLIDDLLQLSRITRSEMQRDAVDLTSAAERIAARLRQTYSERHLEFVIGPGLTTFGDGRLLEVALTNLLGNAVKFTGPCAHARISFETIERDGKPAFVVRDNGVGFDMAYAGTLFGAFQRLHSDSEFPGSGIGLATVQRVIHRHGGRVWAEAEPGRGATFYFTIESEK